MSNCSLFWKMFYLGHYFLCIDIVDKYGGIGVFIRTSNCMMLMYFKLNVFWHISSLLLWIKLFLVFSCRVFILSCYTKCSASQVQRSSIHCFVRSLIGQNASCCKSSPHSACGLRNAAVRAPTAERYLRNSF